MKSSVVRVSGILLLSVPVLPAANPSAALVTHPVYLGEHADAHAIPLSAVPVWHNYGYGIHRVISNPRIFPAGALVSEHGREFDMNLASAYDIEVVPEDDTQVPLLPVTLKVGKRDLPPQARHSRAQALEATLWSLILNTPGSGSDPLVVKIQSDDQDHWRYAGSYVINRDELSLVMGEIPGSRLTRNERGVVSVVFLPPGNPLDFPAAAPVEGPGPELAFVPLLFGGGAEGEDRIALVPHWTGNEETAGRLGLLWTAIPRGMNVLSAKHGENGNPLHSGPFDSQHPGEYSGELWFQGSSETGEAVGPDDRRLFAAACHGAIVTLDPTEASPFGISFHGVPTEAWEILGDDGWELYEGPHGKAGWRRTFTDAGQSILGHRIIPRPEGGWWLDSSETGATDPVEPEETAPQKDLPNGPGEGR